MSNQVIAERQFSSADQELFAGLSRDRNPMHMDALAARRTIASRPAVHGIHALLWSLETLFDREGILDPVRSIDVEFRNFIYVEDQVRLFIISHDDNHLKARLTVDEITVVNVTFSFGSEIEKNPPGPTGSLCEPEEPIDLNFSEISKNQGYTHLPADNLARLSEIFPAVSRMLGQLRLGGLASTSYLVGMICPGLHSIYSRLLLHMNSSKICKTSELSFRTTSSDPRFRKIEMAISGSGWVGVIGAYVRPEPVLQAGFPAVAAKVAADEFVGTSALVIGGSRGLGELVAKIVAAGGGDVTLTYCVGESDAQRVRDEIASHGGTCDLLRYDIKDEPLEQLGKLQRIPNELYYFATPRISSRNDRSFNKARFEDFVDFYISNFHGLCLALKKKFDRKISIFYPSSIFVDQRPAKLTEYAMAKAAGEILCADMPVSERPGPILVRRLPRLPTDQTATLLETDYEDSVDVMLQVVRDIYETRAGLPATGTAARRSS